MLILRRHEDVEKNMLMAKQLSKAELKSHGYQLAQPFNRRRAKTEEGDKCDPRTVNLTASRRLRISTGKVCNRD